MTPKLAALILTASSLCPAVRAQAMPASLLVLSKGDHALFIVDPATLKPVGHVPSGPDPHEVIASSDGKLAYISNYGGGAYHTITVVDLEHRKNLPIIDLGALRGPHGLDFLGGKLWFTAEGAKVIGSYDPMKHMVDWVMGTGQDRTHMIFVTADAKRIVTSNVSSGTMTILEQTVEQPGGPGPGGPPPGGFGANGPPPGAGGPPPGLPSGPPQPPRPPNWDETVVRVGGGAEGFDVSPDAREIWAANAHDGTISILDFTAKKVIETLDADVKGANRLKFTPDGKHVIVSTLGGADVSVFDAATRTPIKRIPVGHGAAGILMNPDGLHAYVACTPDDYVAIIDLKSLEVTGHITAGKQPDGLAWAARP